MTQCKHKFSSDNPGGVMRSWPEPYLNRVLHLFCNNCPAIKLVYEYPSGNKEIIVEAPLDTE